MTGVLGLLVAVLALWLMVCVWCGYGRRFVRFVLVVLAGGGLNMAWMVIGLHAHPFDPHALMAQVAALCYALGAFGIGWLGGRLVRQWRETRVEDAEV